MIDYFFNATKSNFPFKLFGIIHIGCMLIILVGLLLIYLNRKKIKEIKNKILIQRIIAIILLVNMIIFNISHIYYGTFDIKNHLPFHICFISGYLFIFALLFQKKELLKVVFFLSVLGPLPAIIWPELHGTFDTYQFYEYFFDHHFFLLTSFFVYYLENLEIDFKDLIRTVLLALIIYLAMIPVNHLIGSNYVFSGSIPDVVTNTLPFIKNFPTTFVLGILGIIIIGGMYLFSQFDKNERKMSSKLIDKHKI